MTAPSSRFRYFKTSPEVIRLAVMLYIRYPLSLRNVEDLLAQRGIDVSYETVRYWWNRFGPMFAAEIRKKRVERMRAHTHWRWHLDEMFVKAAVDHEGEVLESFATKQRDMAAALKFMKKLMKRHAPPAQKITTDGLRVLQGGDARAGLRAQAGDRPLGQQQAGEQPPATATTRTGHEPLPQDEDPTEIQLRPRFVSQPSQPGPPPHQPGNLQGATLGSPHRVAVSHGLAPAWVWASSVAKETSRP